MISAFLTGCANPRVDRALEAQASLVGLPKDALLSCAGVPERTASAEGLEFFTYSSERLVSYPSPGFGYWPLRSRSAFGYPFGYPFGYSSYYADIRTYSCEATFTLRNGVVERVVYGGAADGASRLSQCYTIVDNCLPLVGAAAGSSGG